MLTPANAARARAARAVAAPDGALCLELPDPRALGWFEARLRRQVEAALRETGHPGTPVRFCLAAGPGRGAPV